jgi:hypothetical protein
MHGIIKEDLVWKRYFVLFIKVSLCRIGDWITFGWQWSLPSPIPSEVKRPQSRTNDSYLTIHIVEVRSNEHNPAILLSSEEY